MTKNEYPMETTEQQSSQNQENSLC